MLITVSELGDKTFFVAVLLAMRHSRRLVLSAVVGALAAMTVLSVLLGQAVSFLPPQVIHYGEISLFLLFGLKLLWDASQMAPASGEAIEQEAAEAIAAQEEGSGLGGKGLSPQVLLWLQMFTLTFVAEWGDRTQISTIALAATYNPIGVTLGAILGHTFCALIAVLGGRLIAGRISERVITAIGGALFILFGLLAIANPN